MRRLAGVIGAGAIILGCGGSTFEDGGAGGSAGNAGTSGSGGTAGGGASGGAGTGGTSGNGGSSASGGTSGSGGTGGTDPTRACTQPSDCVLLPASCCGQCGAATRNDSIALRREAVPAYVMGQCGDEVGCPACFLPQDPTLIAACVQGECEVVDLLTETVTECSSPDECRLRTHDCCECGGDQSEEGLVAINSSRADELTALVCDMPTACDLCQPLPPADAVADCDTGRCRVIRAVP